MQYQVDQQDGQSEGERLLFPWWSAHVCIPLELAVAGALLGSGYTLISIISNPSMFMVDEKDVVDFTEESYEDPLQYDKSTLDGLHEVRETIVLDTCYSICFSFIPNSNHGVFAYILSEYGNCKETLTLSQ